MEDILTEPVCIQRIRTLPVNDLIKVIPAHYDTSFRPRDCLQQLYLQSGRRSGSPLSSFHFFHR
jgi:hypothetical protein